MSEFLQAYRWGMDVKRYMGLYFLSLVGVRGAVSLLQGSGQMAVWTVFQMMAACLLLALAEMPLFPDRELSRRALAGRTAAWAALANGLFAGGGLALGWFSGVPLWGGAVLAALLELGLLAVWVGRHAARRRDTRTLNENLRQFQGEP
ncbi:hypothetical protein [uncultured Oscillibacter sp.]|uniref:hypothetical protein n=1 Tax=uncultured Oscillibacter sp. TaxID=876091 RepID=UPI0025E36E43|nr:hypothetical protein [uncultured Oscillibacter sp.]